MKAQPTQLIWWLVSRASGIVALVLISLSVLMGLAMAARLLRPAHKRAVVRLHEYVALLSLVAIAVHGLALLGDTWLKPGLVGITVPFALGYRPLWTGLGIIGGYLALLLGPSFYLRRRIGARTWRKLHRATFAVWVLSAVHALGSGSDSGTLWLRAVVLLPAIPIAYTLTMRVLARSRPPLPPAHTRRTHPPAHPPTHRQRGAQPTASPTAQKVSSADDPPILSTIGPSGLRGGEDAAQQREMLRPHGTVQYSVESPRNDAAAPPPPTPQSARCDHRDARSVPGRPDADGHR